ncbi:MAG TPA: MFS transporter [Chloroflexia bacterium]|nr:MFS transporter [Chloroflexia bacterium]
MTVGEGRPPAGRALLSTNTMIAFLVLGVSGAAIGPALPWMAEHWHVRLEDAGVLFTMLFTGACVTVPLSGVLLDRVGRKPILVAGLSLMGAGLAILGFAPDLAWAVGGTLVLGLGWGCLDVTLNVFVADLYPASREAALNLTNVAFGFGALVGPLLVGVALQLAATPQVVLLVLSVLGGVAALVFAFLVFPGRAVPAGPAPLTGPVLRQPYVLAAAAMFFLYVGLEIGFGGWAYSFAALGAHLDPAPAALVVSTYWIAFTLGRAAAGLLSHRVAGAHLVLGGALLSAAGAAAVALAPGNAAVLFGGAVLLGAGFAPVFPTAFGLATARYPATAGAVSSVLVMGGTLGGTVLPYLQGRLLAAGGVGATAASIAVLALLVAGIQLMLGRMAVPPDLYPVSREAGREYDIIGS